MIPKNGLFDKGPPRDTSAEYRLLYEPKHESATQARAHCEELWREYRDIAERDFCKRFPVEFRQRWFEMYLAVALRRSGLTVTAPRPGPDLQVVIEGGRVAIEAISPTGGDLLHADAVPEPVYWDEEGNHVAARVPHDQIALRVAHAFRKKREEFDRYRASGYISNDCPCLIAISIRGIPHAWPDAEEFWFRGLYGLGNEFVTVDPQTGRMVSQGREQRSLLERQSGAAEEVSPLIMEDRSEISGVIGVSADVANIPDPLGDDFFVLPHAIPKFPYPSGFIKRGTEVVLTADDNGGWNIARIDHGMSDARGPEKITIEVDGRAVEGEWSRRGRELAVKVGSRGHALILTRAQDPAEVARRVVAEIVLSEARWSSNSPNTD